MRRARPMLPGLLIASLAVLVSGAGPSRAADRTDLLRGHVSFLAPAAPAAGAPLVILLSGCGGLVGPQGPKVIMDRYAEAATRAGAYAAIVDSFGARGIGYEAAVGLVCSGLRLRGRRRAGDILAAEILAEERWGEFSQVILAGWSHGGWSIMELLVAGADPKRVGGLRIEGRFQASRPDAVALFYPYCGFLNSSRRRTWDFEGPLLLVTAEHDTIGPREDCEAAIAHARGDLEGVISIHYPDATHAFDEEEPTLRTDFDYDPVLAAQAADAFEAFVRARIED